MSVRRIVSATGIGLMFFSTLAFGAEAPPLVTPISCVTPGANARITAQVPAALTNGDRPRVFFKAAGQTAEYYVEMQRGTNGTWWAILPWVEKGTAAITYRVAGLDASKNWVTSPPVTVDVSASCPPVTLTQEEQRTASNIVLGLSANAPPVPAGFSCRGVVSVITAGGQLRPATECQSVRAAAAGKRLSTGTIAALSAAALTAGVVIYNNNKGTGAPVSPSRP